MPNEVTSQPPRHLEDRVISALQLNYWDPRIVGWWARNDIILMRIALGIVFFMLDLHG